MIKLSKEELLHDYYIAFASRQASLLGRREVLTGKAKFGIFGDGKELPQLAMAKQFLPGDWRSGYYRDQTFMFATGLMSFETFFAQLYGDPSEEINPATGGRMMNNHFATRTLDSNGNWLQLIDLKNSSADISPTAGQMPRLVGLALASKIYRSCNNIPNAKVHSNRGNEVAFGTIGDASTSEGLFFESINAAGVMQIPMAVSVWDDGYGISVPKELQTTKGSISEILKGFQADNYAKGIYIFKARGWNYPELLEIYEEGISICRKKHVPVLFHIVELTQPQGHSTSGSHERYKDKERLEWEKKYDCIAQMRNWLLSNNQINTKELEEIEAKAIEDIKEARKRAWSHFQQPIVALRNNLIELATTKNCHCVKTDNINALLQELKQVGEPIRKDVISTAKKVLRLFCNSCGSEKPLKAALQDWLTKVVDEGKQMYNSYLYAKEHHDISLEIKPVYDANAKQVTGREILLANNDYLLKQYPELIIFGEDVGKIGGVNQSHEGLQQKYGKHRIFDTGIREATIVGQAIGLAMRGMRPIAEIQYFDYLLYALQVMSDDLATLHYRTKGCQKAPVIISTRGHRLEGIWHSGSPLSMVINSIRGMYVLVPRNMTQAAGFYNNVIRCNNPSLIIEPLNAYRLRETFPSNIGKFITPIGVVEILKEGTDVTLVTYGSCVRIALDAIAQLEAIGISVELIDVQSLLPFDINHTIAKSIAKTNKVVFFDEDVPGGATAYMMQHVLEEQKAFHYLDFEPKTITAQAHRAAYGTDGDYFSNPNAEDVFETIYDMMHQYHPDKYPKIF